MAEALFRELGGGRVDVESAGSRPAGAVNPLTERVLDEAGIGHNWARSKSMNEFLDREFDHVLTVCDDAAEACPVFPGPARRTHWSIPDPVRAVGTEEERLVVYRATLADLRGRIAAFLGTLDG
jgi:arsenate reductase